MSTYAAPPHPVTVTLAGTLGAALALASVALPYEAYLTRPDLIYLFAGLAVLGSGVLVVRTRATGPAGWLLIGAGYAWFLPVLAVSGHPGLDTTLESTGLVHVALLSHAVVVVGSVGVRGRLDGSAVALGYLAAATDVVGMGSGVALPVAGLCLALAVLRGGRTLRPGVRRLRAAAGLTLGVGLVGDALLRALGGGVARPESWIAIEHPAEIAATAVLVALAGTRPAVWAVIDVRTDSLMDLTKTVAAELGSPDLRIALSDGCGGWLSPTGEVWGTSEPQGLVVHDEAGVPCAVLEGTLARPVTSAVRDVLRLAAANARLRQSIVVQVDELEASRRRLLSAADWERASLGAQLRTRVIAQVTAMERELARSPELAAAYSRATSTRDELETIARGIDPVSRDGSLGRAFADLVATAACDVVVEHCDEPRSKDVARALWFCAAEAAANAAKHSHGASLRVSVRRSGATVQATFRDNGSGGADRRGAGISGLADRVETLGGSLQLFSPLTAGTTLEIVLPDDAEKCGQPQGDAAGDPDPRSSGPTYRQGDRLLGGTP